ncbi:MAG: hypothetical protein LBQ59_00885 [Candidatus Peribacteria bacterium]|nr:hypothetical protein [Candidatus Peribacteria bacterium]
MAKLKDIASKNQYIKYEDVQSQQLFNILKVLNYKTILADTKATFNKPLLEAYKKD